jgi:hypothetical protein
MTYYHMDDDQRTNFTKMAKPSNLPIELTSNLSTDLKTWLHDVYGVAFLTQCLDGVTDFNDKLSTKEKERLWYWWSGNVLPLI